MFELSANRVRLRNPVLITPTPMPHGKMECVSLGNIHRSVSIMPGFNLGIRACFTATFISFSLNHLFSPCLGASLGVGLMNFLSNLSSLHALCCS